MHPEGGARAHPESRHHLHPPRLNHPVSPPGALGALRASARNLFTKLCPVSQPTHESAFAAHSTWRLQTNTTSSPPARATATERTPKNENPVSQSTCLASL